MKGIILLANYFEDVEALITIDMLRRAKIEIDLVSMNEDTHVISQSNVQFICEKTYHDVNFQDYTFLVIPGGKATFLTHHKSEFTKNIVTYFYQNNLLIASICAAPSILGMLGYLDNIKFTCFPSCEEYMPKGLYQENESVVCTNNIITSKAAGTTFDFAKAIIKYLLGEEEANKVLNSVYYKN